MVKEEKQLSDIVITFIHDAGEKDIQISNHLEGHQLLQALLEWNGIQNEWAHASRDVEYSFDEKHWFRLDKNQRLEVVGVWDGAFLRLSEGVSNLSTFDEIKELTPCSPEEENETTPALDYAWKILD